MKIHNNQKAFTNIVRDLSKRAGSRVTVEELMEKLKIAFTKIVSIGVFMAEGHTIFFISTCLTPSRG